MFNHWSQQTVTQFQFGCKEVFMKWMLLVAILTVASFAQAQVAAPADAQLFRTERVNADGVKVPSYQVISATLDIPVNALTSEGLKYLTQPNSGCCTDVKVFYSEGKMLGVLPTNAFNVVQDSERMKAVDAIINRYRQNKVDYCSFSFRITPQSINKEFISVPFQTKVAVHNIGFESVGIHGQFTMLSSRSDESYFESDNSWSVECTTYDAANLAAKYIPVSVLLKAVGDKVTVTEF
jgi:hypothetical protein